MSVPPNIPNTDFIEKLTAQDCERGRNLLAAKDYERAKLAYRDAIDRHPASASAYYGIACAHYHLNEYQAALVACNLAIDSDCQQLELDDVYHQRALIAYALHDYTLVIRDCQQILTRSPQYRAAFKLKAIASIDLKDYSAALASFDRYIALYPDDPDGYYYRGICYDRFRQYALALADFDRAIAFKTGRVNFYHARGRTQQKLGNLHEARVDYNRVILRQPLQASAYSNRGEIHRLQGNYRQAIEDCSQAISLRPDSSTTYFCRGITYAELGDLACALADFERALAIDPQHINAYIQAGWIYFRRGKYESVVRNCQATQKINQCCFDAYYLLGITYARLARGEAAPTVMQELAIENFTRAIEIAPIYVSVLYHRGVIYHQQGKTIEALADFERAKSIQDCGLERSIDRDETGFYAEGMAFYYTGQLELAHTMLNLAALTAKQLNNSSFQKEIIKLSKKLTSA